MELLLNQLKHPHPLVLSEENYDDTFKCMVCWDCVVGLCYCCKECVFVVHKWCAELPLQLTNHPLHPHHPRLRLLSARERDGKDAGGSDGEDAEESDRFDVYCRGCDYAQGDAFLPILRTAYAFCCEECLFVLHPECALLPKHLEFGYNDADSKPVGTHLKFIKRPRRWDRCSLCKNLGHEMSSFVDENSNANWFHIQCALLPKTVKHDRHIHDLTLHVPIEKDKSYYGCVCDLCEEDRDLNQWLYYCARCEVAGHLSCGLLGSVPPNKAILTSNSVYAVEREERQRQVDDGSEEYMKAVQRRAARAPGDMEPLGELVHFWHEHPLFLYEDVWDGLNKCRVCKIFIYGKIYACFDCRFFLHKWCAELPREIHFGFHFEHPLTLLSTNRLACSYCKVQSNTFSFCCLECNYGVHTTCAFLFEFGVHKSHCHPLQVLLCEYRRNFKQERLLPTNLAQKSLPTNLAQKSLPPCNACLFPCDGMSLGCEECGFYLHIGCSLYPPTGKAKTHRHNLNLTYSYQEDPRYDEFICDACEKSRIPNCWVYCCPDTKCEIVSHLDCAVPNLFPESSCEKERDANDWVYYRPSPLLHLIHGLEAPGSGQPIQRILKSDPVYALLREKVSETKQEVEELQHFSHEHPLILVGVFFTSVNCKACSGGIYGTAYGCHECRYYLHNLCARIPREMHFKFHREHPLTLLPRHDFECSVCKVKDSGFSFSCQTCDFEAHVLCARMPDPDLEN